MVCVLIRDPRYGAPLNGVKIRSLSLGLFFSSLQDQPLLELDQLSREHGNLRLRSFDCQAH